MVSQGDVLCEHFAQADRDFQEERRRLKEKEKLSREERDDLNLRHLPSPSQIARECAKIRKKWSAHERRGRIVDQRRAGFHWEPPEVDAGVGERALVE